MREEDRSIDDCYSFFRILFGSNHLYVFYHPAEMEAAKLAGRPVREITYDDAQEEIARFSGLNMNDSDSDDNKSKVKRSSLPFFISVFCSVSVAEGRPDGSYSYGK